MEYIEGENLEELLSQRGSPLQEAEALHYIHQICKALVFIHKKRLLHRDIKPQNIMVRKATNDAVLIDFGIARDFLPESTQSITVSYTKNYAPPEQRRRTHIPGNYTDIYGLAATLYYLLTKKPPTDSLERQHEDLEEPQKKKINHNISKRVNEAILWGMELDFKKRPQTVEEWLEFLNPVKVKFDAGDLINSPDKLKKAIINHFCPSELDVFLAGFNRNNIFYDNLDGKYLPEKIKSLIGQLPAP